MAFQEELQSSPPLHTGSAERRSSSEDCARQPGGVTDPFLQLLSETAKSQFDYDASDDEEDDADYASSLESNDEPLSHSIDKKVHSNSCPELPVDLLDAIKLDSAQYAGSASNFDFESSCPLNSKLARSVLAVVTSKSRSTKDKAYQDLTSTELSRVSFVTNTLLNQLGAGEDDELILGMLKYELNALVYDNLTI